jgi:hypothetical protein
MWNIYNIYTQHNNAFQQNDNQYNDFQHDDT